MSEQVLLKNRRADCRPAGFDEYRANGGYKALEKAVLTMSPDEVIKIVSDSGLRGRGGAGFPTGRKWSFVHKDAPHPRYIQCNTDEMEPGTFKDRILVNTDPHLVIEGILMAGYAIQADHGVFFIRPSYDSDAKLLEQELKVAREANLLGKNILGTDFSFDIQVHRSAGRYICGESSAQANAIMGKRPNPDKTTHMTDSGLWNHPTVVNNVETLASTPFIVKNGVDWFKSLAASPTGDGTKLYCVSGEVVAPGCFELPCGTRLGDIIFESAGGMLPGAEFKTCLPGGTSTSFVPKRLLNTAMDFDSMKKEGLSLGTGSVIVFDHNTCLVQATINIMTYFSRESCGWCTPCREGIPYMRHILQRIEQGDAGESDLELLEQIAGGLANAYCGFAPGAATPVKGLLTHFRDEVREHLDGRGCPFKANTNKPGDWRKLDRSEATPRTAGQNDMLGEGK
ncbi:complex I 51 kDa subunit family protein [Desulfovibrio gilichinskyi]|uniref:NADH dehydrogenase subunit F n=1 Tax=Desulfovibrio gilichinskyi TaxID=1519643 RepID=A0A1X7DD41_9BACT|nr:NADH-ubiquinone oxidoreductase-F iron-sulfur binding region domain-containing protein [Desulfovibrio gilichinskyi]SMF13339.1 NADH dehydrogenase subunit F [Desulfovibrio gilichinskyi]